LHRWDNLGWSTFMTNAIKDFQLVWVVESLYDPYEVSVFK
jgi:hypothetical protein